MTVSRVAVDLTPMRPGGPHDEAAHVAVNLTRALAEAAHEIHFVLLTSESSDAELASLDTGNVSRVRVARHSTATRQRAARMGLGRVVPARALRVARNLYGDALIRARPSRLVRELAADLLFCPFTEPTYYHPEVPLVAQVLDLQYATYPQQFTAEQRWSRKRAFVTACRHADRVTCPSDYVRKEILETGKATPDRVTTIRPGRMGRLEPPCPTVTEAALEQLSLRANGFLLYPADFWPHKNHEMLLTAFALFRDRNPRADLGLVCVGESGERAESVRNAATRMSLWPHVRILSDLADPAAGALLEGCRAMIVPSLYEGAGLPLLDAMASGKAVLCSNSTSLPELAGDAALYFDPRRPDQIARAIEIANSDAPELAALGQAGLRRTVEAGQAATAAEAYLAVFREVARPVGTAGH